jgi:2,3-bisphosphoglycerate-dependent phosphoglycerate mutase
MRLFVLVRHGQSELNATRRVNGDPSIAVALTPQGEAEASGLGLQLAGARIDLCVHTRFGRTRQTAELALTGRDVPFATEPLLDDIDVGELEGQTIDEYRAWKRKHTRGDSFPGGESLADAALRYAAAYEGLLERPEERILVVCHEIPVRYAINAAAGSDELDGPAHEIGNCIPHLFDEDGMQRASERIRVLAGSTPSPAQPPEPPPAPSTPR